MWNNTALYARLTIDFLELGGQERIMTALYARLTIDFLERGGQENTEVYNRDIENQ